MALQFKKPLRSRLKVAGTVVKTQQREGAAFYVVPAIIVLAVLIFCYTATPPASARLAQAQKVAEAKAAAQPVKQAAASVAKPAVATTPSKPEGQEAPIPVDETDALAVNEEDDDDDILDLVDESADSDDDMSVWAEDEDDDWIDGGDAEEFVGDEDFESVGEEEEESDADEEADADEVSEEEAVDDDAAAADDSSDNEQIDTQAGESAESDEPTPATPAKTEPVSEEDKKKADEEFQNRLKNLFD